MMLGQNDPYLKRMQQKSSLIVAMTLLALIGLTFIGFGVADFIKGDGIIVRGTWLLFLGLFFPESMAFAAVRNNPMTQPWRTKLQQRQTVLRSPDSYLASQQPSTAQEYPQPPVVNVSMGLRANIIWQAIWFSTMYPVIEGIVDPSLWLNPRKLFTATIVTGVIFLLLLSAFYYLSRRASNRNVMNTNNSLEVTRQGISTNYYAPTIKIPWQDARMFLTYTVMANRKPMKIYEILSENEVARWVYYPQLPALLNITPKMSQHDYDRWMQQTIGYIREQTGLPLIDADLVPVEIESNH